MTKRKYRRVYYLVRDADHAIYELGRYVRRWRPFLGGGRRTRIDPGIPSSRIAARLEKASLAGNWTPDEGALGIYRQGRTPGGGSAYFLAVVEDVRRWASGGHFRFIDERGLSELEADPGWKFDDSIAGSRYAVGSFVSATP